MSEVPCRHSTSASKQKELAKELGKELGKELNATLSPTPVHSLSL
jgi:hypothetical protein